MEGITGPTDTSADSALRLYQELFQAGWHLTDCDHSPDGVWWAHLFHRESRLHAEAEEPTFAEALRGAIAAALKQQPLPDVQCVTAEPVPNSKGEV